MADQAEHAADVEHVGFAAGEQRGEQLAGELDVGREVDPHQPVPVFGRHFVGAAVVGDAGVVDEDVDAAPVVRGWRGRWRRFRSVG